MKKIMSIFLNDLNIAIKDPISLWIAIAPLVIAGLIVWLTPGVDDTSLYIATTNTDKNMIEYFSQVSRVETFASRYEVEERVLKNDHVIGILSEGDKYEIIAQGDEVGDVEEIAKFVLTLYQRNSDIYESKCEIYGFGEKISPIKRSLGASLLLMITMLTGMIISSGIIDDKSDNTIAAVHVTTLTKYQYVIGKSVIGVVILYFSSILSIVILGLTGINWVQLSVVLMSTSVIAMIIGFLMGLTSADIIEAAASIKILMLPMLAAVLVEDLTVPKWHFTMYWNPFYWSYKSLKEIIVGQSASWSLIGINMLVVLIATVLVYMVSKNKIKEGLS